MYTMQRQKDKIKLQIFNQFKNGKIEKNISSRERIKQINKKENNRKIVDLTQNIQLLP